MPDINASQDIFSSIGVRTAADAPVQKESSKQADFLLLMTEQIKHQNPLNPMEGADFLAQLAQFSTVEQLANLNASFDQLSDNLLSDQSLQAASLIGKDAQVVSSTGYLGTEGALKGSVELPLPAGALQVNIYDQVGQLVRQLELGAHPAGEANFAWDGMKDNGEWAGSGTYRMEALADTGQGSQALDILLNARVNGVTLGSQGGGLTLDLAGIGPVSYGDIRAFR